MTTQEAKKIIQAYCSMHQAEFDLQTDNAFGLAICALGALDQIRWERDIAIQQLEELGLSFGEKVDHIKEIIERQK